MQINGPCYGLLYSNIQSCKYREESNTYLLSKYLAMIDTLYEQTLRMNQGMQMHSSQQPQHIQAKLILHAALYDCYVNGRKTFYIHPENETNNSRKLNNADKNNSLINKEFSMVEAFMIADTWFMVWHEKLILLLKRKVHTADFISTRCTKVAVAAPNNAAL